jgi:hypothetical protein
MFAYILAGIFFIWLSVLSYILYTTRNHYFNLVGRTKKYRIDEILDKLLENDSRLLTDIERIKKELVKVIESGDFYFQKIGLVRYNPFGRTGNEQSFVIALLNKQDSGMVINFIYTHQGIRVYAKKVNKNKGEEYNLSEEEEKAIIKAK